MAAASPPWTHVTPLDAYFADGIRVTCTRSFQDDAPYKRGNLCPLTQQTPIRGFGNLDAPANPAIFVKLANSKMQPSLRIEPPSDSKLIIFRVGSRDPSHAPTLLRGPETDVKVTPKKTNIVYKCPIATRHVL